MPVERKVQSPPAFRQKKGVWRDQNLQAAIRAGMGTINYQHNHPSMYKWVTLTTEGIRAVAAASHDVIISFRTER